MPKKNAGWGFDVTELDKSILPQDDFYHFVNKKWMDKNPIPTTESRWGTFMILRYDTDKKLHALLQELLVRKVEKGSSEQIVGDFFRSGMDMKTRDGLGAKPLKPYLEKVDKLKTFKDVTAFIGEMHRIGTGGLWSAGVGQDSKQSEKYAFHLGQDGLGMPDRDYYLNDDPESVRVRTAYISYARGLFKLMGYSPADAGKATDTLMRIETSFARISMTKEDCRDPEKTYKKITVAQLQKLMPAISWESYFKKTGIRNLESVIVMQPDFLKGLSTLLVNESIEDWKTYFSWHLANDFSGMLSEKFVRHSFSFYGKTLSGATKMRPLWRRVVGAVNGGLGELIGKVYVEKYFPKDAKKKMDLLVDDLFLAYEARIKSLDWMTPVTKRKALQKLKAINRKIGYPKKWKSYKGLTIAPKDFVGNLIRMNEFEHVREIKKLSKPIDREEWFMHPQTVNAYFAPNMNDIVFPAAILQPPFFDPSADDAINYGSIGAVIGHEITHGFDDEGSKYDADGNLKSWWTKQDRDRFEQKSKKVEKQYNGYAVAGGLNVNGKLTLGENIADFGGLSIAYDAYQIQLKRTGRKDIDGLTPEQRFFISFAIFERENSRDEFTKTQVLTDPHSPGIFRINGPLSNFEPFYDAFGVTKKSGLYRDGANREMVW